MLRTRLTLLASAAVLAGCTTFPELDAAITPEARRAAYPSLIPVEDILIRRADATLTEAVGDGLRARADGLNARASGMRGPVIDPEERRRMLESLDS